MTLYKSHCRKYYYCLHVDISTHSAEMQCHDKNKKEGSLQTLWLEAILLHYICKFYHSLKLSLSIKQNLISKNTNVKRKILKNCVHQLFRYIEMSCSSLPFWERKVKYTVLLPRAGCTAVHTREKRSSWTFNIRKN